MNPFDRPQHRRPMSRGRRAISSTRCQPNIKHDPVLPRMIAYINNLSPGCVRLKDLRDIFNAFSMVQLWSYVRSNSSNFQIQRENNNEDWNTPSNNDVVWIKTELRLCEKHCRRDKTCSGDCGELHLCRNFLLLGDMCCPFKKSGKICAFGHNLQTNHNSNLLDKHDLQYMSGNELRILFRRRICRSVSTMPQICIYYNGKGGKGCSNKHCRSLHLCLEFVEERCHGLCKKNHAVSDEQVAYILDLFAIDHSWPNDLVLEDLRSIMRKRIRHNSDVSSVVSRDSSSHSGIDEVIDDENTTLGAVGGADKTSLTKHKATNTGCCSHCQEMRKEMIEMKKKMQDLETQIVQLKALQATMTMNQQPEGEDDQFSQEEKEMLAHQLSPIVKEMEPDLSDQITKMILDMDKPQLKEILTSQTNLKSKIEEAAKLLKSFKRK